VSDAENFPTKATKTIGNSGESGMIKADKRLQGTQAHPKHPNPTRSLTALARMAA
jgi:hypothetical protein